MVLAETDPEGHPQGATVHFAGADAEVLAARLEESDSAGVITPLADTHWGTRWLRVRDPDGNLYAVEFAKSD